MRVKNCIGQDKTRENVYYSIQRKERWREGTLLHFNNAHFVAVCKWGRGNIYHVLRALKEQEEANRQERTREPTSTNHFDVELLLVLLAAAPVLVVAARRLQRPFFISTTL